jgi:hypothetical protein
VKHQQPDISDIVEHTMVFWSKRTKQPCSREDARQMLVNVTGFFQVLAEWERQASQETTSSDQGAESQK